ncbi:MAG TPA: hypothetical protein QGH10_01130, partial [Armatimonadota bacterium]|nr:hypothetical protein [Armatimonadota bacterium]
GTLPYMEVEVLSEILKLKPDASHTVTRHWYAAAVPGAVVSTTDAGAVSQPLVVEQGESGSIHLTGVFGVFAEGSVVLSEVDEEGTKISELAGFPASPAAPLSIDEEIEVSRGATTIALDLKNSNGTPIGRIAEATIPELERPEIADAEDGEGTQQGE